MDGEPEREHGLTRRAALKAGVAVGVGVVAWTGASITSIGGTPAYAQATTSGVIAVELSQGCQNTSSLEERPACPFAYHPLKVFGLPPGYSITNNIPDRTCCSDNWVATLHFPAQTIAAAFIVFNLPPECLGRRLGGLANGPESDGSLDIVFSCTDTPIPSSTQYHIVALSGPTGTPPELFTLDHVP